MQGAGRVVAFMVAGAVLTPLISALLAGLGENAGWLPGSRLVHRFGLQQAQGRWWSIETMGNAFVDEVIAHPFGDEATAREHFERARKVMGAVLKNEGTARVHAMAEEFTLPGWQDATGGNVAANERADAKGLGYATDRAFGFPMRYGHWRTVAGGAPSSVEVEGALPLGPVPIATIVHWPGLAVDSVCWGVMAGALWTAGKVAVRRIRGPRAAKNAPA